MANRDRVFSFVSCGANAVISFAGAFAIAVAVGGGANAVIAVAGVSTFAFVGAFVSAGADDLKPASALAGLFIGLAAVGGLAYALQADPADTAAGSDTAAHVATLEDHGKPLAATFEAADGSRFELMLSQVVTVPAGPTDPYLAPPP